MGKKVERIFVGGLSETTTDRDLQDYFGSFGRPCKATLKTDRDGRSRGFGFVAFTGGVPEGVLDQTHPIDGRNVGCRVADQQAEERQAVSEANRAAFSGGKAGWDASGKAGSGCSKIFVGGLESRGERPQAERSC